MQITDWQQQIIRASILGGASLIKPKKGKHHYLIMRHRDSNWLTYKIKELEDFFWEAKISQNQNTYRCQTASMSYFDELRVTFFKDSKRIISLDDLSLFRDIGLAVWFLDSGGKTGRGYQNLYLNTTLLGQEGSEVVQHFFKEIIEWPCNINKNKNRLRVVFSKDGSIEFLKTIAEKLPVFMQYRL